MRFLSIGIILIVFCVDILYMTSIYINICKNKEKYKNHNRISSAISMLLLAINGIIIFANDFSDILTFYNMLILVICTIKNILTIEKFKISFNEDFFEDETTSKNINAIVVEADEEDYGL